MTGTWRAFCRLSPPLRHVVQASQLARHGASHDMALRILDRRERKCAPSCSHLRLRLIPSPPRPLPIPCPAAFDRGTVDEAVALVQRICHLCDLPVKGPTYLRNRRMLMSVPKSPFKFKKSAMSQFVWGYHEASHSPALSTRLVVASLAALPLLPNSIHGLGSCQGDDFAHVGLGMVLSIWGTIPFELPLAFTLTCRGRWHSQSARSAGSGFSCTACARLGSR